VNAPLFRWTGSKWPLVPRIAPLVRAHLDATGGRLLSLFYGSGAIELASAPPGAILAADANPELRNLYAQLSRPGGARLVFHHLQGLEHARCLPRSLAAFLAVRAQDPDQLPPAARAARFLWLSALVFNGLWRVNRSGLLNVPPDPRRLARPWPFASAERLAEAAAALPTAPLCSDWRQVLDQASPGDVVLSDPPYMDGFDAYTRHRFPLLEQHQLAAALRHLSRRRVGIIAFNSPRAHSLYSSWASTTTVFRSGRMNCRGDRRGRVAELLACATLHGACATEAA
jgi:DNA adenine methylase